ncbi:hypothetical protein R5R35_013424 [Gryllus longicercus]|uniref:Cytochrome b-c1 complex subunit Rieske, mitochondrial n=1 Tax=Gryllus longicercus TaxID=2509291 RepID=A0AAN9ZA11_9ORTH
MINVVARTSNLAPYLKSTTQVVASGLKPLAAPVPVVSDKVNSQPAPTYLTSYSLSQQLPKGYVSVKSGVPVTTQIRHAHTDIQIPDFSPYRRRDVQNSNVSSRNSEESRKAFTYMIVGGGSIVSAYAAKTLVGDFVSSMSATADVLALAKIEIKLSDIPEGKSVTFKWRGKPLFIRHRTASEIDIERNVNVASLRDPQHDNERVQKPQWLVLIGVCTHLGCVPIANAGDYGGYYCPCHGSHYDASGRIRKGPAPLNLEIPFYEFPEDDLLIVG